MDATDDKLTSMLVRLAASPFRARFHLDARDRAYLDERGREQILDHARSFIAERLAPAHPRNDGKQTPMRGHPVFVAQHATATCCRGCLEKWHGISAGQALSAGQQAYAVALIGRWLDAEAARPAARRPASEKRTRNENVGKAQDQGDLFAGGGLARGPGPDAKRG